MQDFDDRVFAALVDRGGQAFEACRFRNCQFVNCGFSLSENVDKQSVARNVDIIDCHFCNVVAGPGIIENAVVEGLSTDDVVTFYGTLFRHIVLRGRIGRICISTQASPFFLRPDAQAAFDARRKLFYSTDEWSLDITQSEFEECDIAGIPAQSIRVDPSRQFVLERAHAMREGWRRKIGPRCAYWVDVIEGFLSDGDDSTVLVVPGYESSRQRANLLDGLRELRDLGVVT